MAATVSVITSTSSVEVSKASVNRNRAFFHNRGAGSAAILIGEGDASAANSTRILAANEFWEVPVDVKDRIAAIMLTAGSLNCTIVN